MGQRVTVAVPDQLFKRLQPVKKHFNISAVCQEALEMAVVTQELKIQATEGMGLVERLQAEKAVLLHNVQQEGFELGIRSSSTLSYQDFRHFERVNAVAAHLDEDALEYLWDFLDFKAYPQQARLHDPDFAHLLKVDPQSRVFFAQGWVDGVLSVWQAIKSQVDVN
ncbi:MAG: hypothetical protein F6K30_23740 [Cyanothece sp. SIO2G6]|nr:hypothetical protein [Cyanothece sp. SIO2G6]